VANPEENSSQKQRGAILAKEQCAKPNQVKKGGNRWYKTGGKKKSPRGKGQLNQRRASSKGGERGMGGGLTPGEKGGRKGKKKRRRTTQGIHKSSVGKTTKRQSAVELGVTGTAVLGT